MFKKLMPFIVGLAFIGFGILTIVLDANNAKVCTEPVLGTFAGYEESVGEDSTSYFPVFQYKADGKTITSKANVGSGSRPYTEGETYNLRYNPDDPYQYIIEGDKTSGTATTICFIAGAICIIVQILSLLGIGRSSGGTVYTTKNGAQVSGLFVDIAAMISWAVKNHKDKKNSEDTPEQ